MGWLRPRRTRHVLRHELAIGFLDHVIHTDATAANTALVHLERRRARVGGRLQPERYCSSVPRITLKTLESLIKSKIQDVLQ